jgi:methyl-accepting chemotaxis protein
MKIETEYPTMRRLLGPGLLLVVVLVAGAFLEAAADEGPEAWLVRAYLIISILAVAAYLFLVYLPERSLERRLVELEAVYREQCDAIKESLEDLRYGDLVAALEHLSDLPDDMQQVMEATTGSMAGLFQQIQSSSVSVATSATGVRETAADLATGSSQQAAAVVEITATTEELARTAGTIAANAVSQAELAARSEAAGDEGAAAIEAAVSGVEAVRDRIEVMSDRADTLGSRAREIYRVLDLITEIAQETHILSLNAAIEASAAGEHGDRFGVVADEVRRLAERSRESVDSVRSMLDEFSAAIRGMVVSTEEGAKSAVQVLERSRSTQDSVAQLRQALTETATAAREISLATEEQRAASDQVVITLREVSEVIQRMADGLARFTGAAEELNELALGIQLLTQSFRLDSAHSLKNRAIAWAERVSESSANPETVEVMFGELMESCPYLEMAYLVDVDGTMMAFKVSENVAERNDISPAVGVGGSYEERPWYRAVHREHRTVVTPLYESLLTGDACFTVATPVRSPSGEVTGTFGIDVNAVDWTRI